MLLFFLLGLLSFPSQMPSVILPAVAIALFLTFIARPAAVFAILTPFKKQSQTAFACIVVRAQGSRVDCICRHGDGESGFYEQRYISYCF